MSDNLTTPQTSTASTNLTCDGEGRFERLLEPGAKHRFEARDDAGRWTEAVADDVAPGTRDLVLQMTEPRYFVARVRDRDGHPLSSASVKIHREGADEPHGQHLGLIGTKDLQGTWIGRPFDQYPVAGV